MAFDSAQDFNNEGLRYDLRQHWASLIGVWLTEVMQAVKENDFVLWKENLENLYSCISYKFKEADKEENKKLVDEYKNAIKASEFAYQNLQADRKDRGLIHFKLNNYMMFLISMMDKHKFFGGAEDVEGM